MNKIMLDIETTGNIANTAIIQLSMIRFDTEGNLGDYIKINIDAEEQYKLGAQPTQSTLDWWQNTNKELFESITTKDVHSVKDALDLVDSFVRWDDEIWCHASFDMPILDNLYHLAGDRKRPWKYLNVKDIRTLTGLSGINLKSYNWAKEKTHDSLDDCKFQVKYTTDAMKLLKGNANSEANLERMISGLCEIENSITEMPKTTKEINTIGTQIFNLRVEQMKAMDLINQDNKFSYSNWISE